MSTSKLFLLLAITPVSLQAQTTVTLTTTPNPSTFGAAVTLTATVTPATSAGKVTFYDGVTILGAKSLVSGTVSISTIALPAGTRKLHAYYAGANSNVVTQAVNAKPSAGLVSHSLSPAVTNLLAVADFNGDGKTDLATLNASTLSILLGDGTGNFHQAFTTPSNAFTAAPGDFNGDGIIDLAVSSGSTTTIMLGVGDGTFQSPASYPGASFQLAVGDFNGDGNADIVTIDPNVGVNILLGRGDGIFQSPVSYSTGPQSPNGGSNFVLVGDFNGDGKADLAVANQGNTIGILLGNGDGTFLPANIIPVSGLPRNLAMADFNGDGKTDLAAGSGDLLLGNGDGTFRHLYFPAEYLSPVWSGDFNGDGIADLATGIYSIHVLLGNGDGSFQSSVDYLTASNSIPVSVADFNGDGKTDLAVITGNFLSLLLGTSVSLTPTGNPQSTVAGTPFPNQLQVTLRDGPNPISGITVTFAAPSSGPSAVLSSTTATTDANGNASVMATANSQPGSYTVTATAVVLGVSTSFSLTNLRAQPSVITASPIVPQVALVGTAFAKPLRVTITDASGLPASGTTVTFTAPSNGPSAVLSSTAATTDVSGNASVMATANSQPGSYTVTATAGALTATFSLTNVLPATVTLAALANTSTFGGPVTLTASVSPTAATGHVTFFDGVAILGSKPISAGVASISTILLPAGNRKLSAFYSGDAKYGTATSNIVTQAVKAVAGGLFSIQGTVSPLPIPITAVGPTSRTVVTGDFNGDGKADFATLAQDKGSWWQVDLGASATIGSIVIWNRTDCCSNRLSDYWVFVSNTPFSASDTPATLQNRAGTFAFHQTFNPTIPTFPNPSATIAVNAPGRYVRVQLSAPGYLSLAEVQVFGSGSQSGTNLALGKPAAQSSTYPGIRSAVAASAVDGNTDGNFLHGSVSSTGLYFVSVELGNGDGTFQPPSLAAIGGAPGAIATGDFNQDGIPDLAVLSVTPLPVMVFPPVLSANQSLTILLGNGDGTFGPWIDYAATTGTVVEPLAIADFNGDGKADALVGSSFYEGNSIFGGGLFLLTGGGDGTFGASMTYGPPPTSFAIADFNADGIADVAMVGGASAYDSSILLGNGDGTHQPRLTLPLALGGAGSSNTNPLVAADFNGDGKIDLAVGTVAFQSGTSVGATSILIANGDGTFQSPVTYPQGSAVASGDFNADGITDLVVTDSSGNLSGILYGKGDGTFQQGITIAAGAPLAVADFNGDGRADILVANADGTVSVLLGSPSTGAAITLTAVGGTPQSAAVGTGFAAPLQVKVLNNGVPLVGVTVSFAAPTVGASAALSTSTAVTNAAGVASVTATANSVAGSYLVTASYQGVTAAFSLTNTSYAFLVATGGTPQSAAVGTPFANPLQATVKDQIGNPVPGVTVSFSAPTVGASAALSGLTAVTNASGVASVTATANNIAGSYMVTASLGSLSASFSLTNTAAGLSNVALRKTATQSSTYPGYPSAAASSAVDGKTDGNFANGSVTATNLDPNAWWQVDVGASTSISSIVIWNRTDCCAARLSDYWVFVSDTPFLALDTPVTLQNRPGTFASHQTASPNPSTMIAAAVQGRYVRVQLSGTDYLSLAEVQVFGTGGAPAPTNLSQGKIAMQSSTYPGSPSPNVAVDGSTDGNFADGSVTATNQDPNAWWQVDLGGSAAVSSVVIWNRTDCCASRLSDYWVFISDTPFLATDTPATLQNRANTFASHQIGAPTPSTTISLSAQGRYVRVQLSGTDYLSLAEVQVFGTGGAPAPTNLAQGKTASQSSTLPGTPLATVAVDGNTDGAFFDGSVTATNNDANAWWQVDLGGSKTVSSVVVWNRTDCCGSRLSDYWVFVSNTPFLAMDTPATLQNRAGTFASHQTTAPSPSVSIPVGAQGQYVRVQLSSPNYLSLAEVQVFGQ